MTDFSSVAIPAFALACLIKAWTFWRAGYVMVWKSNVSRRPPFV